jgi:hypothetical protein
MYELPEEVEEHKKEVRHVTKGFAKVWLKE